MLSSEEHYLEGRKEFVIFKALGGEKKKSNLEFSNQEKGYFIRRVTLRHPQPNANLRVDY
jgi:ribosomal protein S12